MKSHVSYPPVSLEGPPQADSVFESVCAGTATLLIFMNVPVVLDRFHGIPKLASVALIAALLASIPVRQFVRHGIRGFYLAVPSCWPALALFVIIEAASAARAPIPREAQIVLQTHVIEFVAVIWLLTQAIQSRAALRGAVIGVVIGAGLLGTMSAWQYMAGPIGHEFGGFAQLPQEGPGFRTTGFLNQKRAAGPIGEQNRYAQNMLMAAPLAFFPLLSRSTRWRLLYGTCGALILAGTALTFSRGAVVAIAILVCLLTAKGLVQARHLLALGVAACLLTLLIPQVRDRFRTLVTAVAYVSGQQAAQTEGLDGAVLGRATSMLSAARVAASHPWLGVGPGNFPAYNRQYARVGGLRAQEEDRQAHSLYLHLAAETGLVGLAAFLAVLLTTLHHLMRSYQRCMDADPLLASIAIGLWTALCAYLLTGIFLHLSYVRFLALFVGLGSATPLVIDHLAAFQQQRLKQSHLLTHLITGKETAGA